MLNKKTGIEPGSLFTPYSTDIKKLFQQSSEELNNIFIYYFRLSSDLSASTIGENWNWHLVSVYKFYNVFRNRLSRLHRASPSAFLDKYVFKELAQR